MTSRPAKAASKITHNLVGAFLTWRFRSAVSNINNVLSSREPTWFDPIALLGHRVVLLIRRGHKQRFGAVVGL